MNQQRKSETKPVDWRGRKFGELTPDEQAQAVSEAGAIVFDSETGKQISEALDKINS